jgi:tetratricopeptide (TPR) repeat protein
MPISTMRQAFSQSMVGPEGGAVGGLVSHTSAITKAALIPLPPRVVHRIELVDQLTSEKGDIGALWLNGSSGLGKTVLAQFIARGSERDWFLIELRGCSGSELEYRLRTSVTAINTRGFGGIILDDFPVEHASSGRLRLSILAAEVRRCDGEIVITSTRPPSPSLENCFGKFGIHVADVPYLTKKDVAELVSFAGGDAKKWASIIHTFCGFGHPQLVDARISGLKRRGWPENELLAGIVPIGGSAKEVDAERTAIRARLIAELPENAREILYRLTLTVGSFDRAFAIAIGEINPAVPRPGEAFDILVGPWIEARAQDRFNVSPLIGDAGTRNLSKEVQSSAHRGIVDHLITRQPFPAEFLGQLLSHALISRHEAGLTWLAAAVAHAGHETRHSVMLRLIQFQIAIALNRTDRLGSIFHRFIAEARMIEPDDASNGMLILAISMGLIERSLPVRPSKWVPLLVEFEGLLSGDSETAIMARTFDPVKAGLQDWSVCQFIFVCRETALSGINELLELFDQLNQLGANQRNTLIAALREPYAGIRLMVHSSWLADHNKGDINGVKAAQEFMELGVIAEHWGHRAITIECECARAVMLDEYAKDPDAALAALSDADIKYPGDVRIARQRAKIHYRRDHYDAALEEFARIADVLPHDDEIERAFALREAGISAANTGDVQTARRFFEKAHASARNVSDHMRPMAAGLKGDCAVVEFQMKNYKEALRLSAEALREGEEIDPEAGPKEKYFALVLGHMILWMRSEVQGSDWLGEDMPIVAGGCSNPEPPAEIVKRQTPPKLLHWYQLAELEAELGIDASILEELRKRTAGSQITLYELTLNSRIMWRNIRLVKLDDFCSYLPEYVSKTAFAINNRAKLEAENILNPKTETVPLLEPEDWIGVPYLALAQNVILALQINAVCSGRGDIRDELAARIGDIDGAGTALKPFLKCFNRDLTNTGIVQEIAAACIGRLSNPDDPLSPDELFMVTCYFLNWLEISEFKSMLGSILADFLVERWRLVIEKQQFLLKQPMQTVPAIRAAVESSYRGVAKMAMIALAAEDAVHHRLGGQMRDFLKKSAA